MKVRTRQEIADQLGISRPTLDRWLKPVMPMLIEHGYTNHYVLTVPMLRIIYRHLGIREEDFQ